MAKPSESKLTIEVNAQVDEAVNGFKRLTKAVKEATRALKEYESVANRIGELNPPDVNLNIVPPKQQSAEDIANKVIKKLKKTRVTSKLY